MKMMILKGVAFGLVVLGIIVTVAIVYQEAYHSGWMTGFNLASEIDNCSRHGGVWETWIERCTVTVP